MEILAKHLLQLRKEKKLSRQAVADAVQISAKTYERYESGEREPAATTLAALADFFEVSANYLLGRSDCR